MPWGLHHTFLMVWSAWRLISVNFWSETFSALLKAISSSLIFSADCFLSCSRTFTTSSNPCCKPPTCCLLISASFNSSLLLAEISDICIYKKHFPCWKCPQSLPVQCFIQSCKLTTCILIAIYTKIQDKLQILSYQGCVHRKKERIDWRSKDFLAGQSLMRFSASAALCSDFLKQSDLTPNLSQWSPKIFASKHLLQVYTRTQNVFEA